VSLFGNLEPLLLLGRSGLLLSECLGCAAPMLRPAVDLDR
jgi:hypothetical protein